MGIELQKLNGFKIFVHQKQQKQGQI
ncbi:hypothetical protein EJ110_NYTH49029 [Nymphaea thermarum]|nr:hypothetical protein EJ110_NYTH49029 [Nymphaea thermarum]